MRDIGTAKQYIRKMPQASAAGRKIWLIGYWRRDRRYDKVCGPDSRQGCSVAARINGQKRYSSGVVRELLQIVG